MRKAKKTLALLLTLTMLLSLFPAMSVTAYADYQCPNEHTGLADWGDGSYYCPICDWVYDVNELTGGGGDQTHTHEWSYYSIENEAWITASCDDFSCPEGYNYPGFTLTINAPDDLVCDGNAKEATISGDDGFEVVPAAPSSISYTPGGNAPTEPGNYTASFSWGGQTASVSFTLTAPVVAVTGVTIMQGETAVGNDAIPMIVGGDTVTLTATVTPGDATDKTVVWLSDDEDVATVNNGVVTGVAAGTATITAKATNGTDTADDDVSATCAVTVSEPAPAHTHAWTYAAGTDDAANTVTATCTEGCPEGYDTTGFTLSISAPTGELVADGTTAYPASLNDYNAAAFPDEYTISYTKDGEAYTGDCTEAGAYVASVTVGDVTASVSYTVALPVAQVGDALYASFASALSNWANDTTLTLLADVTVSSKITVNNGAQKTLDLNGKTLTLASTETGQRLIEVLGNGTVFTLRDSSGTNAGILTGVNPGSNDGGWSGTIYINNGAAVNMYGGTITGNTTKNGAGVWIDGRNNGAIFNMYGGVITGNTATTGGGVYVGCQLNGSSNNSAQFNLYDGTITGNNAANGKNVFIDHGVLNIKQALTNTTPIGVTKASPGVFTNSADTSFNDPSKFVSDKENFMIGVNVSGQLVLGAPVTATYTTEHGTAPEAQTMASGSALTLPAAVEAEGLTFGCWSEGNAPFAADSITTLNANTTFAAQWLPYSVTLTGGAHATVGGGELTQTGLEGEMTTVTLTPEEGYAFPRTGEVYTGRGGVIGVINDDGVITVSGTPSFHVTLAVPNAAPIIAKVGEVFYSNLADAQNAWVDGTTLTLLADIYGNITTTGGTKVLDLNGHGVRANGGTAVRIEGGNVTIQDSNPSAVHYFSLNNGLATDISDEQGARALSFTGGFITGGTGSKQYSGYYGPGYFWGDGGGVWLLNGSCTMTGGTVLGNSSGFGGGVEVYKGTFTLAGGKVSYNGGNGAVDTRSNANETARFVMTSGEISYNRGDGLNNYYTYGGSVITVTGGSIHHNGGAGLSGNQVIIGGTASITHNSSTGGRFGALSLSGGPTIENNGTNGSYQNLYISNDKLITIAGELTNTTPIAVTMQTAGVFTNGLSGKGDASNFTSLNGRIELTEANEAQLIWEYVTVSFEAGEESSGTMEPVQNILKGTSYTLPACDFTVPEGKYFDKWTDGTNTYAVGESAFLSADTAFTAQWLDYMTVSFEAGEGGSGDGPDAMYVKPGATITLPAVTFTVSAGKYFEGWKTAGDDTLYTAGSTYTVPAADTVFTAQWAYKIPDSGEVTADLTGKPVGYSVKVYDEGGPNGNYHNYANGKLIITPPAGCGLNVAGSVSVESDYDFFYYNDGTETKITGEGKSIDKRSANTVSLQITSDYSVNKAGVNLTVTVIEATSALFDPNGGTGEMAIIKVLPGGTVTLPACTFTPPEGQLFLNWTDGTNNYNVGATVTLNEDTTFTAVYVDAVVASFEAGEGEGDAYSFDGVLPGTVITLPENTFTAPEGKLFLNWTDGTNNYNAGATVTLNEDTTFTAVYVDAAVASFEAGEGEGDAYSFDGVLPGTVITLPENTFTAPEGQLFFYWTDGTNNYNAGARVTLNENTTFTAVYVDAVVASFAPGEGEGETYSFDGVLPGTVITLPENTFTAPEGQLFFYWTDGTNDYNVGARVTLNENTTFTAVYVDPVVASFAPGVGEGESYSFDGVLPGTVITLPQNTFAAPDDKRAFAGWLASATDAVYDPGDSFILTASTVFTAQWELIPATADMTVNENGGNTNGYVPIYGYYVDEHSYSQFIMPADMLEGLSGTQIRGLTFYASNPSKDWGSAQFEVYMAEVENTTLSALVDWASLTKVMNSRKLSISDYTMTVTLDTPFDYQGGNLLIGIRETDTGTYSSCNWIGVSAEGASLGGYDSRINQQNFLPKVSFTYVPDIGVLNMPKNLSVDSASSDSAVLSWTSSAEVFDLELDGTVIENVTNPYTLTGLEPATAYSVRVRAKSGEEVGEWCNTFSFHTELAELYHDVTYRFEDSRLDGWNGARICLSDKETGIVFASLTLENGLAQRIGTVSLPAGRTIVATWVCGSKDYECSYAIKDVYGNLVFLSSGMMDAPLEYAVPIELENVPATSLTIENSKLDLWRGASQILSTEVEPADASFWSPVWSSSDESVVTVDSWTGKLTSVRVGTATVTATLLNGTPDDDSDDLVVSCVVTVMRNNVEEIGEYQTGFNGVPTYVSSGYWTSQQIYTAEELGGAGTISGIAFRTDYATITRNVDIYLGHTEKDAFSNGDALAALDDAVLVYSGNYAITAYEWSAVTFTTPFAYNGEDNLIIHFVDHTGSGYNGECYFLCDNTHNVVMSSGAYSPEEAAGVDPEYCDHYRNVIHLYFSFPEAAEEHTHAWTYTAGTDEAANTVTATCTEGCPDGYDTTGITLTINAPENLECDGSAKAAVISGYPETAPDGLAAAPDSIHYCEGTDPNGMADATAPTQPGTYTASFSWGDNLSTAYVTYTLTEPTVAVTGVALKQGEDTVSALTLTVGGDTATLTATVSPDEATDKTVVWSSDDETVATVDQNGVVTPVGAGTATITATATNGTDDTSDDVFATCTVTVELHVHSYGEPSWTWRKVSGAWNAVAVFNCEANDDTQTVRATLTSEESEGVVTYTAKASFRGVEYTCEDHMTDARSYKVTFGGETVGDWYSWGELCTLNFTVTDPEHQTSNRAWFINGKMVADGRSSYTFAVTENSDVTTDNTTKNLPQAVISPTISTPVSGKAVYKVKWSLPTGAEVVSAMIYRGAKSTEDFVTPALLISKGVKIDTGLYVRNGDFTLTISNLSSNKYQNVVTVVTYRVNGEEKTLTAPVAHVMADGNDTGAINGTE